MFLSLSLANSRTALRHKVCHCWHFASSVALWADGGLLIPIEDPISSECIVRLSVEITILPQPGGAGQAERIYVRDQSKSKKSSIREWDAER